jgi:hypothetical protein
MANFNLPEVIDWAISISTSPPAPGPGGSTFAFGFQIFLKDRPQPVLLSVATVDEFMAILNLLQIPAGRMMFNQAGGTLIRTLL